MSRCYWVRLRPSATPLKSRREPARRLSGPQNFSAGKCRRFSLTGFTTRNSRVDRVHIPRCLERCPEPRATRDRQHGAGYYGRRFGGIAALLRNRRSVWRSYFFPLPERVLHAPLCRHGGGIQLVRTPPVPAERHAALGVDVIEPIRDGAFRRPVVEYDWFGYFDGHGEQRRFRSRSSHRGTAAVCPAATRLDPGGEPLSKAGTVPASQKGRLSASRVRGCANDSHTACDSSMAGSGELGDLVSHPVVDQRSAAVVAPGCRYFYPARCGELGARHPRQLLAFLRGRDRAYVFCERHAVVHLVFRLPAVEFARLVRVVARRCRVRIGSCVPGSCRRARADGDAHLA